MMRDKAVSVASLFLILFFLGCPVCWSGEFSYYGLARTEMAFSTTGDRTQPTDAGTTFDNDGRSLNLAALRLELDGIYNIDRHRSLRGKFRAWGDWTNHLDNHYNSSVDLYANSSYPGDGALLSSSSNQAIADVPEIYYDWTKNNAWLRTGKQQIAWGDAIGMRILDDMVSSLDIRRHGGAFDLGAEEFRDERIGQIGVRGSWRIPDTEWELEGLITDFAPTLAFPAGSAYASFPSAVLVLDDEGISEARDKPVLGIRAKGYVLDGRGEVTLAWTRRPQSIGVLKFDVARDLGLLLTTGKLPLRQEHPRINIIGGAFSYSFSADREGAFSFFDGMIGRVEAAYYSNKRYSNSNAVPVAALGGLPVAFAGEPFKDDELSIGFVLEKHHRFRPDWLSTYIVFEGWHRTKSDFNDKHQSLENDSDWTWFLISITQPFKHNSVSAALNIAYDTSGGYYLQPALTWKPNRKIQLDIFFNYFEGDADDVYGPLQPNKEIAVRFGTFF